MYIKIFSNWQKFSHKSRNLEIFRHRFSSQCGPCEIESQNFVTLCLATRTLIS